MQGASLHHSSQLLLNFSAHELFQTQSRGDLVLVITTWLPVLIVVPLCTVSILIDLELDGVITGSNRSHVPFKLLDLAALVKMAKRNCKQVGNQATYVTCGSHLEILIVERSLILDTSVLGEEKRLLIIALGRWSVIHPKFVI